MELNFNRLNALTADTTEDTHSKILTEGGKRLQNEANNTRDINQRVTEIYKEYQENINISSQLQNEITKGIQAGEQIEFLLLKAIKCISLMTGNNLFYEMNRDNIKMLKCVGTFISKIEE